MFAVGLGTLCWKNGTEAEIVSLMDMSTWHHMYVRLSYKKFFVTCMLTDRSDGIFGSATFDAPGYGRWEPSGTFDRLDD